MEGDALAYRILIFGMRNIPTVRAGYEVSWTSLNRTSDPAGYPTRDVFMPNCRTFAHTQKLRDDRRHSVGTWIQFIQNTQNVVCEFPIPRHQ